MADGDNCGSTPLGLPTGSPEFISLISSGRSGQSRPIFCEPMDGARGRAMGRTLLKVAKHVGWLWMELTNQAARPPPSLVSNLRPSPTHSIHYAAAKAAPGPIAESSFKLHAARSRVPWSSPRSRCAALAHGRARGLLMQTAAATATPTAETCS